MKESVIYQIPQSETAPSVGHFKDLVLFVYFLLVFCIFNTFIPFTSVGPLEPHEIMSNEEVECLPCVCVRARSIERRMYVRKLMSTTFLEILFRS